LLTQSERDKITMGTSKYTLIVMEKFSGRCTVQRDCYI
jgi:hypothetical protein